MLVLIYNSYIYIGTSKLHVFLSGSLKPSRTVRRGESTKPDLVHLDL